MFGHHDDDQPDEGHENTAVAPDEHVATAPPPPADDTPASSFNENELVPAAPADNPAPEPAPVDNGQHPGTPLNDDKASINDIISPAGGFPKRPTYQYPQGAPPPGVEPDAVTANPELIDIRDHALEELEPLLDKLDLPPEDKFRLIMMILQYKDEESLVKKAYEAAHAIEDDDVRGRALYDIVNEVNYFTQPPSESE